MRTNIRLLHFIAPLLLGFTIVACSTGGVVTTTPGNTGALATASAACTPTPLARHPTFTVAPNNRSTPGAFNTAIARYQATYPGDVIIPTQTVDLAPQIPSADKETLVVRHANCTYDYVLLPSSDVASYQSTLPSGDTIVAQAPPESSFGKHPPPPPTLMPNQTPGISYGPNGTTIPAGATPPGSVVPPPPSALQTSVVETLGTRTAATSTSPASTSRP